MERNKILTYSIPVLFVLGLLGFFILVPAELQELTTLIGYMSSLSTVIMVLVYLLTTSQQLDAMNKQLNEMRYSRNVQYQPLLSLEDITPEMQAPRYYTSPEVGFLRMELKCRIFLRSKVINIGNGPAISILFAPKTISKNDEVIIEAYGKRVEYLSLREGDSEDISLLFIDHENKSVESLLQDRYFFIDISIFYKNSVGLPFEQKLRLGISLDSKEEFEKIKSCLKIIRTAKIDYGSKELEYQTLREKGEHEEAKIIMNQANEEISEIIGDEEVKVNSRIVPGSFSINSLSQQEYVTKISEYEEMVKRVLAER